MQRREFLTMAAVGAAGLAWPHASPAPAPELASPRLLDLLGDDQLVRALGERYRELAPGEDDARVLAQAILPEPHRVGDAGLQAWLADRVRRDFADGHTVAVRGWILSVTEARQCALYSLTRA